MTLEFWVKDMQDKSIDNQTQVIFENTIDNKTALIRISLNNTILN